MTDPRIKKLAKLLVTYSVSLKKGEKVLIEAYGIDISLVNAIVEEVYAVGAYPFVELFEQKVTRAILNGITDAHATMMAKYASARMQEMQAYIGIRGGNNSFELSDVDPKKMQIYDKFYSHPVHHHLRVDKTKWCVLRFPTEGMSALARMSTAAFEDFYFDVCTMDYAKMGKAMDNLDALLRRTDKVKITGPGTDISFSIKGIGSRKCAGTHNIPDGEVYSAPVKTSVNGVISYNAPSIMKGIEFKDMKLTFKNGKIVDVSCNNVKAANAIFDTDAGARYTGEFALGVNPFIKNPMGDILFDEKISGSIHFTPGSCYDEANNGNKSAIHWDLVLIQTPEYGGGEIYFDDVLIRKDGLFVIKELECLNPKALV